MVLASVVNAKPLILEDAQHPLCLNKTKAAKPFQIGGFCQAGEDVNNAAQSPQAGHPHSWALGEAPQA
jgi:hypothetical protein